MSTKQVKNGYAGTILTVDLSNRTIEKTQLDAGLARGFLGGQGVNARLLYDRLSSGIDPLGEDNALIFGAGALVGTMAPTASRASVGAKSPLTGYLGYSGTGHLGGMLKYAGYDHIIIKGKSDRPVYLRIQDDNVDIMGADELWGKDIFEATDSLWQKVGQDYCIASIGQAGENLVRFACIEVNKHSAFGRTGMGAVMGSKKLKAIAVLGTKGIRVADRGRFMKAVDTMLERQFKDKDVVQKARDYGSRQSILTQYPRRLRRSKNPHLFDAKRYLEGFYHKGVACPGCPIGCKRFIQARGGKYPELAFTVGCTNSTLMGPYGQATGIGDMDDIAKACQLGQRYGLDTLTIDAVLRLAIELYQHGIISNADTGGLELERGAATVLHELIRRVAFREGIGDVLAEGPFRACRRIGGRAESYLDYHVKGLPLTAESVTNPWTTIAPHIVGEFVQARGAHLDGFHYPSMLTVVDPKAAEAKVRAFIPEIGFPEKAVDRLFPPGSPQGYNVPLWTRYVEDFNLVLQTFGVCDRDTSSYNIELLNELYASATGFDTTPAELLKAGERVCNLQRAFNVREGATREDDMPSRALFEWSLEANDGRVYPPLKREFVNSILDEYYRARQWDVRSGRPTARTLIELGLEDVATDISKRG